MLSKQDVRKRFSEHVRYHIYCGYMLNFHFPKADTLSDEVVTHIYVFSSGMVFRVVSQGFRTFVIDMEWYWFMSTTVKLSKNITKPDLLLTRVIKSLILCLGAGEGDIRLLS